MPSNSRLASLGRQITSSATPTSTIRPWRTRRSRRSDGGDRCICWRVLTLLAHVVSYVGVLVFALGPWEALMVIVIHKAVGGFYLASVFAPNHKRMPQTNDESGLDFLRAQRA